MADSTRGPNLGHLLKSGQFSDLTLVCRGQEFNVHKAVVCAQSKVLAAAIREPFQASKTGKIVIEEYDTDTAEQLVEFLYTGDYRPQPHQTEEKRDDTEPEENLEQQMLVTSIADSSDRQHHQAEDASQVPAPEEDLVQHVLVNSIADYYDIKALADLSKEKLQHALRDANKSHLLEEATVALRRTGDTTVHAMLAEEIAKNIRQHLETGELAAVVGGFAMGILKRVVATDDESRLKTQHHKTKLAAAEIDSEREREERKQIQANFDECRKVLDKTKPSARAVNLVA